MDSFLKIKSTRFHYSKFDWQLNDNIQQGMKWLASRSYAAPWFCLMRRQGRGTATQCSSLFNSYCHFFYLTIRLLSEYELIFRV